MEFFLLFEVFSVYTVIDISRLAADTYTRLPQTISLYNRLLGKQARFFS